MIIIEVFNGHDDYSIKIENGRIVNISQGNNYAGCSCESCGTDRYNKSTQTIVCKHFKECFRTNFNKTLSEEQKEELISKITDEKILSWIGHKKILWCK